MGLQLTRYRARSRAGICSPHTSSSQVSRADLTFLQPLLPAVFAPLEEDGVKPLSLVPELEQAMSLRLQGRKTPDCKARPAKPS